MRQESEYTVVLGVIKMKKGCLMWRFWRGS